MGPTWVVQRWSNGEPTRWSNMWSNKWSNKWSNMCLVVIIYIYTHIVCFKVNFIYMVIPDLQVCVGLLCMRYMCLF